MYLILNLSTGLALSILLVISILFSIVIYYYRNLRKKLLLSLQQLNKTILGQQKELEYALHIIEQQKEQLSLSINVIKRQKEALDIKKKEISFLLSEKDREIISTLLEMSSRNVFIHEIKKQLKTIINNDGADKYLIKLINQIDHHLSSDEIWTELNYQFIKTNPSFYRNLSSLCPSLTVNEFKHCSFVAMNLTVKDVANILFINPKSVEMARYRIKKKLNLDRSINLFTFLKNLEKEPIALKAL